MSHFNYYYTCPDIDRNISDFKNTVKDLLTDLIADICPILEQTDICNNIIESYVEHIYNDCEGIFENVRSCNEDIRTEAERQMTEYEETIEDLTQEVKQLEQDVESLQEELAGENI